MTAQAYLAALDEGGVRGELPRAAAAVDADDETVLRATADRLRAQVCGLPLPGWLRHQVLQAYAALGCDVPVAVRSSATGEDGAGTSFAGMNATFTSVVGGEAVLDAVRRCWASLYGARVIAYRRRLGVIDEPAIAVVVQQMVAGDRSGVMFTADPGTGQRDRVVIEATFGLGEVVGGGLVEPDTCVVERVGPRLLSVRVGRKQFLIRPDDQARVDLPPEKGSQLVLTVAEVLELARVSEEIEEHYGAPQDVEWAFDEGGRLLVLQARPITTLQAPVPRSNPTGPTARWSAGSARHLASLPGASGT